ncbi:MAG: heparan-alpha-glucosaminide N-acetyltransferase [Methanoculleaceae archaeon]
MRIFTYRLVITAVTAIIVPWGTILFGILHCIGLSIIIAPLFFRLGRYNALTGLVVILTGWRAAPRYGPIWLLWLGIHPTAWTTLDCYPLVPWFGVVLMGYAVGRICYPEGLRRAGIPVPDAGRWLWLISIGQHSLFIYFIHQPVILGVLSLVMLLTGAL